MSWKLVRGSRCMARGHGGPVRKRQCRGRGAAGFRLTAAGHAAAVDRNAIQMDQEMRRLFLLAPLLALLAAPPPALAADKNTRPAKASKEERNTAPPAPPVTVVQNYTPRPAMWKLADADTTIYLFGTFHLLPPGLRWRTPTFDAALASAQELVVETSDADSEEIEEEAAAPMLAMMKDRPATSSRLSQPNVAKWRMLASGADMPYGVFDQMPVLFAMMSAGLSFAEMQGSDRDTGVETILEAEFAKAGKPILSIEDPVTVIGGLLAIDEAPLIAQLDKDLTAWNGETVEGLFAWDADKGTQAEPLADEHAWAKGQSTPVFTAEDLAEPGARAIHDALLTDRNRAWVGWLSDRLASPGTVMVAVGAGHFDGETSVIAELARRNLTAERIQ